MLCRRMAALLDHSQAASHLVLARTRALHAMHFKILSDSLTQT